MAKITNLQLVEQAYKDLASGILYKNEDCVTWVRSCIKRAGGGSHKFSGASDMFRTAGTPYKLAKDNLSKLLPGELLFIEDKAINGASHMGIYAGNGKCLHSSATHDKLVESDNMAMWTHAMRTKLIQYIDGPAEDLQGVPTIDAPVNTEDVPDGYVRVLVKVRMRRAPSTKGNVIRELMPGETLRLMGGPLESDGKLWANIVYQGEKYAHYGFAVIEDDGGIYLQLPGDAADAPDPVPNPMDAQEDTTDPINAGDLTRPMPPETLALVSELADTINHAQDLIRRITGNG